MMISTKGRYALRFLVDIAEHQAEGYVPLKDVAERQGISEKYLESIVKTLVRADVLSGLRGKGGGYRLRKSPDQYGVREILSLLEGPLVPSNYLIFHEKWAAPHGCSPLFSSSWSITY